MDDIIRFGPELALLIAAGRHRRGRCDAAAAARERRSFSIALGL